MTPELTPAVLGQSPVLYRIFPDADPWASSLRAHPLCCLLIFSAAAFVKCLVPSRLISMLQKKNSLRRSRIMSHYMRLFGGFPPPRVSHSPAHLLCICPRRFGLAAITSQPTKLHCGINPGNFWIAFDNACSPANMKYMVWASAHQGVGVPCAKLAHYNVPASTGRCLPRAGLTLLNIFLRNVTTSTHHPKTALYDFAFVLSPLPLRPFRPPLTPPPLGDTGTVCLWTFTLIQVLLENARVRLRFYEPRPLCRYSNGSECVLIPKAKISAGFICRPRQGVPRRYVAHRGFATALFLALLGSLLSACVSPHSLPSLPPCPPAHPEPESISQNASPRVGRLCGALCAAARWPEQRGASGSFLGQ